MIAGLLEKGEGRLVAAVETGLIPLGLAVDIARLPDGEAQLALAEAYEQGKIKGPRIGVVRRLLEQRARRTGGVRQNPLGRKSPPRKLTGDELVKLYEKETDRQRVLVKKSDFTQTRLLFVVEALRDLRSDEGFIAIMQAERLDTMPRGLAERVV
jgi:ParB family chromosome partitioning protein